MSQKERVLYNLDLLKAVFVLLLTAFFGVFGYFVTHLFELERIQTILGVAGFVFLVALFCFVTWLMNKQLDKLEEM